MKFTIDPTMLPPWMAPVTMAEGDYERITPALANYNAWSNIKSAIIVTEMDAKIALVIEVRTKHRPLLIERIKHRYNLLRHKREMNELYRSELHREGYRESVDTGVPQEKVAVPEVRKSGKNRRT